MFFGSGRILTNYWTFTFSTETPTHHSWSSLINCGVSEKTFQVSSFVYEALAQSQDYLNAEKEIHKVELHLFWICFRSLWSNLDEIIPILPNCHNCMLIISFVSDQQIISKALWFHFHVEQTKCDCEKKMCPIIQRVSWHSTPVWPE